MSKEQRRFHYKLFSSGLLLIATAMVTGCFCRNRITTKETPTLTESDSGAELGSSSRLESMALNSFYERHSIAEIVYSSEDDEPGLKVKNAELVTRILDKEEQLGWLHKNYWITGDGRAELLKAQEPWKELRELDALFAARGEHGYSLARYLYLQEKLRITEERIEYVKKKIR